MNNPELQHGWQILARGPVLGKFAVGDIREAHATTTGRAALVVLLPIGVIVLLVLIVAIVAGVAVLSSLS